MLADKKVLLGVTGGIAAYKAVDLVSKLIKRKAEVRIIMTESACEMISPLTFRSITRQPVTTEMFNAEMPIEHIALADWCDIAVIAPATANIIGKVACGIADDLLSTTLMAVKAPKLIVPAMNVNMWDNLIVQENIRKLEKYGYLIVPPDTGMLACGYEGKGRFPDTEEIVTFIESSLCYMRDLSGKTVLITTGACREYIDPVRYISNSSSGKMGIALARAVYQRGAKVILITADIREKTPYYLEDRCAVLTSADIYRAAKDNVDRADIVIMTAAVTDYMPVSYEDKKKKKGEDNISLQMQPTQDVLHSLYRNKRTDQLFIGFAAETDNLLENGKKKLHKCDMVIVNDIKVTGENNTSISILTNDEETLQFEGSKFQAAHKIIDRAILKLSNR